MKSKMARAFSAALCLIAVSSASVLAAEPSTRPQESGGKARVFITDSNSWSVSGGFGGSSGGFGGGVSGGARPQTVEIIKTFGEKCPSVTVTMKQDMADFVVLLDHEGGKGWARKDNKVAVFNRAGDAILSKSTRSLGNSVKDACEAIMASPVPPREPPPSAQAPAPAPAKAKAAAQPVSPAPAEDTPAEPPLARPAATVDTPQPCSVLVKSTPEGADITVDGKYAGNTPSNLQLTPGDHTITIQLDGFRTWSRTMTTTAGGWVTLDAKMEKNP